MVNLSSVNERVIEQLNLPRDVKNGVVIAEVMAKGSAKSSRITSLRCLSLKWMDKRSKVFKTYVKFFYSHKVSDKMEVTYYRNGQKQTTTISLTETEQSQVYNNNEQGVG